ncbi:MAG TPA: phage holin family protein [Methylomirabilota bacterium]|nr:phage holin family protein [Methylomirabilota bacterium]
MAIVQAVVAFIGRSFGRILSALFDWAVVAIFGYTSGTEKIFLSGLLAAAGAWPLLLLGIAFPKVATFLLAFVPVPSWVPSWVVRVVWIALAVVVPLAVGVAMAARQPPDRPRRSWPSRLLRGFPITIGLSAALLITIVTVPVLRLVSAIRARKDVQVPLLTDQKSYREVAGRVRVVMEDHGRPVRRVRPPWWLTAPLRVLSAMDHDAFESRIPKDMAYFEGRDLVLALYPSGLLIRGRTDTLALAQGLIIEGVSDLPVWQTSEPRAQAIEQRIAVLWQTVEEAGGPGRLGPSTVRLGEIARAIEELAVEYAEWQIVYRKALQLGRALDRQPQLLAGLVHKEETMQRYEARAGGGGRNGGPSTRALVNEIGGQLVELAQNEVELARAELASDVRAGRNAAASIAIGAVVALMGATMLLVAGALALAIVMPGWLAALVVAAVVLTIGIATALVGWNRRPRAALTLTRKSLKEDWEWLKAQVS